MTDFQRLRAAHRARARELMPEMAALVEASRHDLDRHRQNALRALLARAVRRSPWHRDRLAGIDPATFRLQDLDSLPTMTKNDLMGNFDAVATDPRITLERCEAHIAQGSVYMDGEFMASASGGTTGKRAIGVSDREDAARGWTALIRFLARWGRRTGRLQATPRTAVVAAGPGPHASDFLARVFADDHGGPRLSVLHPLDEIVAALNAAEPEHLVCYSSMVPQLLAEVRAGRLRIRPAVLSPAAEPFPAEHEEAVADVWGSAMMPSWGATEVGFLGGGSGFDPGMLLYDDLVIVEPVDVDGRPVQPGIRADKLFVTPLYRHALPVIRYELTDQLTVVDEPPSCGSSFTRVTGVLGRLEEAFVYESGPVAHPHLFNDVLCEERSIRAYQVRQTHRGAEVRIVAPEDTDTARIARQLEERLARLGLDDPRVDVLEVADVERRGAAAKVRRFIPLTERRDD